MTQPADIKIVGKDLIAENIPLRDNNSHKGTFGHVLNIAGSPMYPGAAYLSSVSALKVGAGQCTLASSEDVVGIMSCNSPDITYINLGQSKYGTIPKSALKILDTLEGFDAVSIGCGLSMNDEVGDFVINFLKHHKESYCPIIIDADALNIAAERKFCDFPMNSIITPHPAELARLMGVSVKEIQQNRARWAWEACRKYDCMVILKGHETIISVPTGRVYLNRTGNSALAKAGTGDVLTGMIAGLCAQIDVNKSEEAAYIAVFIHGVAGELAAKNQTEYGVLASDLLRYIPQAFKIILNK
ncbi:NAD(P)H-hydrate dehydratase [bacterium]|nr:NAD(P)H-hydrate dehydratase [bacterium]